MFTINSKCCTKIRTFKLELITTRLTLMEGDKAVNIVEKGGHLEYLGAEQKQKKY